MPKFTRSFEPLFVCFALAISAVFINPLSAVGQQDRPAPYPEIPSPAPEAPATVEDLPPLLGGLDPDHLLQVTLVTFEILEGHPCGIEDGVLLLVRPEVYESNGCSGPGGSLLQADLADIFHIRQRRSGFARGATWGVTSGSVLGAGFGALMGAFLAELSGPEHSSTGGAIIGAVAVGVTGAFVGGGIGGGIGAMTTAWYDLYPGGPAPEQPVLRPIPPPTRLWLQGSMAGAEVHGNAIDGLGIRAALLRRFGHWIEAGPAVAFYNLDTSFTRTSPGGVEYYTGVDPVLNAGLDIRFAPEGPGLAPYGIAGAGWYTNSDVFIGMQVGGGLRLRDDGGRDYDLDARYHFNILGEEVGSVNRFWTVSAGFSFGL